ncbi:hypothetical protein [Shewanella surugensis]|uniref:Uncharacterized protein n=1 Tax=Shewanella surugensis TaxID=212020 RepID=A0ABT0L7F4_9GAMM|nr:hypothetical protein [Shewanella surugensis]MCL1123619.1 hypothetical protein [Shewanella surugensis]
MNNKTSPFSAVTPAFMADYDHVHPSGGRHPQCLRNRLANVGIDARKHLSSQLDLNLLTDRQYQFIAETSDDGWLIGGGDSTKLKRADTAHAEIWRTGPDNVEQGGLSYSVINTVLKSIAFGPMLLKPLRVNYTDTNELELLFEYDPSSNIGLLLALLSQVMACPCGDYGNPFHITLVRGVAFRSEQTKVHFFEQVGEVVLNWRARYSEGVLFGDGGVDFFANREEILFHYSPRLASGVEADIPALLKMIAER